MHAQSLADQVPQASTSRPVLHQPDASAAQEMVYMPPEGRSLILTENISLWLYDKATEVFMEQEREAQANLWVVEKLEFPCWLTVAGNGGKLWVSSPIDNSMPLTFAEVCRFLMTLGTR